MRVIRILSKLLGPCRGIHKARARCVLEVAASLVGGQRLSVTGMGRALRGRALTKHNIKRVDRLLSNPRLRDERWRWYRMIAHRLLVGVLRPLLLIDWTEANGCVALVVSVPVQGRSIAIYSEVHPKRRYNNRKVVAAYLETLKRIIPCRCRPIFVADAGFQGPFYEMVHSLRWGYVARIRGPRRKFDGKTYGEILKRATRKALFLGHWTPHWSKSTRLLVLAKRPRKFRHGRAKWNHPAYRRRHSEAWLLVTNERQATPEEVVNAYAQRMQIEETFRDIKSTRYGWGFRLSQSRQPRRLDALMLLAALASFAAVAVGFVAEARNLHRSFQANTSKHRVLSLLQLGCQILYRDAKFHCRIYEFVQPFREKLRALFPQKPNRQFIDWGTELPF